MRHLIALSLAIACLAGPAWAQDADSLRKELSEMKRQLEQMRQQYERTIDTLERRLNEIERRPSPAAPTTATPPLPSAPVAQTPAGTPSLRDLAQPRQPFSLYERRGGGQLLFDIGIAGDFVANFTSRNVDKADGGTFDGRENRLFPREIELALFGQVDPYARAEVRIEAAEEAAGAETEVHLAEAHMTLLTLPWGTQAKFGLMRNRFGLANQSHLHDLPWVDGPNVLKNFFGEEGLVEKGVELSIVPRLPIFLEGLVGFFNGDNEVAFGRGKITYPLVTGRLRTFFDIGDTQAIQLGVSGARGSTVERLSNTVLGADLKYKWTPEGWRHPLLTLGGEALYGRRVVEDLDGDGIPDDKRTRWRFGWYTWAEVQPWRLVALGARFDSSQYPVNPGREWAIEPYVTFKPSEFLRFRLAYKHTDRSHPFDAAGAGGSARNVNEILLQGTFILGAHPPHQF